MTPAEQVRAYDQCLVRVLTIMASLPVMTEEWRLAYSLFEKIRTRIREMVLSDPALAMVLPAFSSDVIKTDQP